MQDLSPSAKAEVQMLIDGIESDRQTSDALRAERLPGRAKASVMTDEQLTRALDALINRSFTPHPECIIALNKHAQAVGLTATLSKKTVKKIKKVVAKRPARQLVAH